MPEWAKELLIDGALACVTLLVPVLLVYLRQSARRLAELVDVKLSEQQWRDVDATLEMAVQYAEEFARKAIKRGTPAQSSEKLQVALETARRVSPAAMQVYDDEDVRAMIESKLGAMRPVIELARARPSP